MSFNFSRPTSQSLKLTHAQCGPSRSEAQKEACVVTIISIADYKDLIALNFQNPDE